jgi:hypothetical protein
MNVTFTLRRVSRILRHRRVYLSHFHYEPNLPHIIDFDYPSPVEHERSDKDIQAVAKSHEWTKSGGVL